VNAFIDPGTEVTILDTAFDEQIRNLYVKIENRLRLVRADSSLFKRSGTIKVTQVQL